MIKAQCLFHQGPAGYITVDQLEPGLATYDFMPNRSVSHLLLEEILAKEHRAEVIIEWKHHPIEMYVTEMSARSITLIPKPAHES